MTLFTAQEVADILKVGVKKVYLYVKEGQLHASRLGDGKVLRFTLKDIQDFLGGNNAGTNQETDVRSSLAHSPAERPKE